MTEHRIVLFVQGFDIGLRPLESLKVLPVRVTCMWPSGWLNLPVPVFEEGLCRVRCPLCAPVLSPVKTGNRNSGIESVGRL